MLSIIAVKTSNSISHEVLRERAERAENGRSTIFIARVDNDEVGFLCYEDWSDKSIGFICEIFVLPGYRGQGIGRRFLFYSEWIAKSLRCSSIQLEPYALDRTVDTSWLVAWYSKHGYAPMPADPTRMEKALIVASA